MVAARVAYVFAGGDVLPSAIATSLGPELEGRGPSVLVVAADSGLDHARSLGQAVDLLVGDLDSISVDGFEAAQEAGTAIEQHPAEKDQTDLELALDAAARWGADRVVVVGGHGGRVDHLLGNVLLFASSKYRDIEVDAISEAGRLSVVHRHRLLPATPGDLCTLLAVHGSAEGVRTEGLRWPLAGETLEAGSSRGLSNIAVASELRVSVESGVVLVVLPGR